jgi:hypothetical protein
MANERRCRRRSRPHGPPDEYAWCEVLEDDPAALLADLLLEILSYLKKQGEIMESISRDTQTAEQKRARHGDNIRTIQRNCIDQLRDLNAGLERLQNEHPTLAMGDLFMSVHQLDSNFRAALDVAKEAAELDDVDDIRRPDALINTESSSTLPASPLAAPAQVHIDQTEQPRPEVLDSPNREHDTPGV